ncbi:hypothetical protein R3P38DRAFT_2772655 [Favolaschia claudopus]|uniref:Uncharacterized protein n=1 Tax=Favolaschia claudopus TaxID=2862362 RepID=A0AAW0C374_9AGAR
MDSKLSPFLLSVSVLKSSADLNILLGQLFLKDASPLLAMYPSFKPFPLIFSCQSLQKHKNVSGSGNDTALGVEVKRISGWEECSVCHLLAYWTFADAGKWVMSGIQDARCSANTESVSSGHIQGNLYSMGTANSSAALAALSILLAALVTPLGCYSSELPRASAAPHD